MTATLTDGANGTNGADEGPALKPQDWQTAVDLLRQMLHEKGCVSSVALRAALEERKIPNARDLVVKLRYPTDDTDSSMPRPDFPIITHGKSFYSEEAFKRIEAEKAEKAEVAAQVGGAEIVVPSPQIDRRAPVTASDAREREDEEISRKPLRQEEARLVNYIGSALEDIYDSEFVPSKDTPYVFDVHSSRAGSDFENVDLLAVHWRSHDRVEIITVEAKLAFTSRCVQQANNYRRFSDRVWIAVPTSSMDGAGELRETDPLLFEYVIEAEWASWHAAEGRGAATSRSLSNGHDAASLTRSSGTICSSATAPSSRRHRSSRPAKRASRVSVSRHAPVAWGRPSAAASAATLTSGRMLRALLATGLLMLLPRAALPCSCSPPDPAQARVALGRAAVVVLGRVTRIRAGPYAGPVEVTLEVRSRWKGADSPSQVVATSSLGSGDCGFPFSVGESYLVFGYPAAARPPDVGMCDFTMPLADAAPVLAHLPVPSAPSRRLPALPELPRPAGGALPSAGERALLLRLLLAHDYVGRLLFRGSESSPLVVFARNALMAGVNMGPVGWVPRPPVILPLDAISPGQMYVAIDQIGVAGRAATVHLRIAIKGGADSLSIHAAFARKPRETWSLAAVDFEPGPALPGAGR
jgi:hypothetical protein